MESREDVNNSGDRDPGLENPPDPDPHPGDSLNPDPPNPDSPSPASNDSALVHTPEVTSPSPLAEAEEDGVLDAEFSDAEITEDHAEVSEPPASPAAGPHLLNSQGFLVSQPSASSLPERPPVVMPSSSETLTFDELTLQTFQDLEMSDDDDDDDEHANPSQSTSSAFQEALPLASAIRRPKPQRKRIGRRDPAKLSQANIPVRKPTLPIIISTRRKLSSQPSQSSDPGHSKDSIPDSFPDRISDDNLPDDHPPDLAAPT